MDSGGGNRCRILMRTRLDKSNRTRFLRCLLCRVISPITNFYCISVTLVSRNIIANYLKGHPKSTYSFVKFLNTEHSEYLATKLSLTNQCSVTIRVNDENMSPSLEHNQSEHVKVLFCYRSHSIDLNRFP